MSRLVTQKFMYIPSHYLFEYEGKNYIKRDDGTVLNTEEKADRDWKEWEHGNDAIVWIDPSSILFQILGPDVQLHRVSTGEDVFGIEGLEESYGELVWNNGVWHWNNVVFLSSQVIHINQVLKAIYIEV